MRRNNYYNPNHNNYNNQYGGDDSLSSIDEYLERVTMLQRMPSVASDTVPDIPIHPQHYSHRDQRTPHHVRHDHNRAHAPEKHKKVHIAEHEEVIHVGHDGKREVYEQDKTIDVEADGFIEQRHKKFELAKWDTLRAF